MSITNDYIAFCFDEACTVLAMWLEEKKDIKFKVESKHKKAVKYKNFSDFYKSLGVDNIGR